MKREKEKIVALNNYIHETSSSGCEVVKENAFIAGFEIADRTMLDRACKWLQDGGYFVNSNETIEDFRKAMKGGAE